MVAPAGGSSRVLFTALALAAAGVVPPILVTVSPAVRALIGPPLPADLLLGLLIVAPAAVGVAVALVGLPQLAATLKREAGSEAEHALLRVLVDTILAAATFAFAETMATAGISTMALPVAAVGLAAAWGLLFWLILQPLPVPLRWRLGMALDIALLSAFLHLSGSAGAGLYPLYLAIVFYAGYRFGERALTETAIAGLAGFGVAVFTTEFWWDQPALALGLVAALILLLAFLVRSLRATAAARARALEVEEGRARSLAAIADALRPPLTMLRDGAPGASPRILAERLSDALDLLAVETGQFAVAAEPFDLRALVNETLGPLAAAAADNSVAVRWRVDPRIPPRLRGPFQVLVRVLASLGGHLVEAAGSGGLRVFLDLIDRAAGRVRVRLRIDARGAPPDPAPTGEPLAENAAAMAWEQEALTIGLVTRLVALIGGELSIEGGPGPPCRFAMALSLAVEARAPEADLDLCGHQVLLVSNDEAFVGQLASLLDRWQADSRWVGDSEAASAEVAALDPSRGTTLIVDGRDRPLAALAFAENVKRLDAGAPFILFVGENSRIDRLIELDEDALDCLLPMPINERLLANAFRGLPLALAVYRDQKTIEPAPLLGDANEGVTPIAAHPKYGTGTATSIDTDTIERLRALGEGEAFLRELTDTFRADAAFLLDQLRRAAVAGDATAFRRGLAVLRRTVGQLGGRRFREQLPGSFDITEEQLRQHGGLHLQQIAAEIEHVIAALEDLPPAQEGHTAA